MKQRIRTAQLFGRRKAVAELNARRFMDCIAGVGRISFCQMQAQRFYSYLVNTIPVNTPLLFRKLPITRLQAVGIVLVLYVLGYVALMDRRSPAVEYGKGLYWVAYQSSFRFAPQEHGYPTPTLWNSAYYPLDKIYFELFPSHRKYGDWKDVEHRYPF